MFRRGNREKPPVGPSPEYADLSGNTPLADIVALQQANTQTRQAYRKMDSITDQQQMHERLKRKMHEHLQILETLQTAANHSLVVSFFEQMESAIVIPNQKKDADYHSPYAGQDAFGSPEALIAQAQNLRILRAPDTRFGSSTLTDLPVWIIGRRSEIVGKGRKAYAHTQYLAVGSEDGLPSNAQNYSYHPEGRPRVHAAMQPDGFLDKVTRADLHNPRTRKDSEQLAHTVSHAIRGRKYGIIRFTGPDQLGETLLTPQDITILKHNKHDTYDVRPASICVLARKYAVNEVSDMSIAQLDNDTMRIFDVPSHMERLAAAYGLGAQLYDALSHTDIAHRQAEAHVNRLLDSSI